MLPQPSRSDRRTFLAAAAGASLALPRLAAHVLPDAGETIPWDEFVKRLEALAAVRRDAEDSYLYEAASWVLRLAEIPSGEMHDMRVLPGAAQAHLFRTRGLVVSRFRLAPDAEVPLHDHGGYAVLAMGMEGEFRMVSYERVSKDGDEKLALRRVADEVVLPGNVLSLSTSRKNYHRLTAGAVGAVGLEVFTLMKKRGGSRFFELSSEPIADGVFEATPR